MSLTRDSIITMLQKKIDTILDRIDPELKRKFESLKPILIGATDEESTSALVEFNNSLGLITTDLPYEEEDARYELHTMIAQQLFAHTNPGVAFPDPDSREESDKDNLAMIEHQLFQAHGLHPKWLISKHLHDRSNITVVKGAQADLIAVSERLREPRLAKETDEFDPLLPPPPPPARLGRFSGMRKPAYLDDVDFEMIAQQKGKELIASGVGKEGSIETMTQIGIDGMAILRFLGPISPELGRDESAYHHGPGFIILDSHLDLDLYQSPSCGTTLYEIPVRNLIFLVENKDSKDKLLENLGKARDLGIIAEERVMTITANVKTYEEYRIKLGLEPDDEDEEKAVPNPS